MSYVSNLNCALLVQDSIKNPIFAVTQDAMWQIRIVYPPNLWMCLQYCHTRQQCLTEFLRCDRVSPSQKAVNSFQIAQCQFRPVQLEFHLRCHERNRRTTSSWEITLPCAEAASDSRNAASTSTRSRTCRAVALFGNLLIARIASSLNESVAFMQSAYHVAAGAQRSQWCPAFRL